ncbi:hypothetical protein [Streptomyces sp. NPDC056361]|uniref:hypothetical protein n=1 Tax=Streptomyces sp. NPDC056361 TaxID=3345795 RepID=UPI0035E045DD
MNTARGSGNPGPGPGRADGQVVAACDNGAADGGRSEITLRLADRLIAAGKDFELLVVPGAERTFIDHLAYVRKCCWDFLVRELMGTQPPAHCPAPIAISPRCSPNCSPDRDTADEEPAGLDVSVDQAHKAVLDAFAAWQLSSGSSGEDVPAQRLVRLLAEERR